MKRSRREKNRDEEERKASHPSILLPRSTSTRPGEALEMTTGTNSTMTTTILGRPSPK